MTDYYSLPDGKGGTDLVLEKALSHSEGGFARAMREYVIPRKALDDDAKGALAMFAALMFVRLPAQHKQMNDFQVETVKMTMEMMRGVYGKDEETWQAYLKQMEEKTGQSFSGLRPEHFDPDKFEITIPHERTLALAFAKVVKLADVIMNMGWKLYYAAEPESFITSDQPLALHSRVLEGQSFYRPGLMWPDDVELTLPLSRSVALFGSWSEDGVTLKDAMTREVKAFNLRSATYTRRFASMSMACGRSNWPGPVPFVPQVIKNLPFLSNFITRLFT